MRHTAAKITDEQINKSKEEVAVMMKIIRILAPLTPKQRWWVLAAVKLKVDQDGEP